MRWNMHITLLHCFAYWTTDINPHDKPSRDTDDKIPLQSNPHNKFNRFSITAQTVSSTQSSTHSFYHQHHHSQRFPVRSFSSLDYSIPQNTQLLPSIGSFKRSLKTQLLSLPASHVPHLATPAPLTWLAWVCTVYKFCNNNNTVNRVVL